MPTRKPRLLVKTSQLPTSFNFGISRAPFTATPLFPAAKTTRGAAMAAEPIWHAVELPPEAAAGSLWDVCHAMQTNGLGFTGAPRIEFAEPDLEQEWPFTNQSDLAAKAFAAASGDACTAPDPPKTKDYPVPPQPFDWRWYLDANHSGLADARKGLAGGANPVVIAHLDTGYRKDHKILPPLLDHTLERSFVEGDANPNSAVDPDVEGFPNNPGHGTGTIGLLAGGVFDGTPFGLAKDQVGGAPFARIIPIRVANSVVLFTNSSIAKGIQYAIDSGANILSMSMGGVPSQLWADMVNKAYEAGLFMVTAAGNNFGPGKVRVPRFIVYPARFRRVVAACGVMSDFHPYADFLNPGAMGGSYGPDSKMDTAIAAFTPNTAWAKYACPDLVAFDGAGTSSATPQVAAAAACWLQKNFAAVKNYPEKWMRVEAIRQALFASADPKDREHFGRGLIRAAKALQLAPPAAASLQMTPADKIGLPLLSGIFNVLFGARGGRNERQLLEIEAAQVATRSGALQKILTAESIDPDAEPKDIPLAVRQQILEAIASHSSASKHLRQAIGASLRQTTVSVATPAVPAGATPATIPAPAVPTTPSLFPAPPIPTPTARRLRVFAFDPALRAEVETEALSETTLDVLWEPDLQPGPVGEYLEVVDVDPPSNSAYAPVDLNHPHLLAANGLAPSEGVPQFHQQMVYAVAMTTIKRFEEALGRKALWAPRQLSSEDGEFHNYYVQRLRIYPHALCEANAFYSPPTKSLLFGYFRANRLRAGNNLPGGIVFNCLSHDVVAHETTHALLDGLHRYYQEQTNEDIAAFHEAFADIVALFQHFTLPAALRHTIAKTRGDLARNNLLADLAQQFGQATNGSRALRSGIGQPPSPQDYSNATEPHDRGAVLLAAIFDAFLQIYSVRSQDLKRLATNGTGVLPPGDISVDLVNRLAEEAAKAARHVLNVCIRALDYCPPVDLTYGDYLRALITADMDLEPEDAWNYRTAFITGFRARGIYPSGVRSLSEESLRWGGPQFQLTCGDIDHMFSALNLDWNLFTPRKEAYLKSEMNGAELWKWFKYSLPEAHARELQKDLGVYLYASPDMPKGVKVNSRGEPILQIHSVRPARRIGGNGQQQTDLVVEMVQTFTVPDSKTKFRGGCTLILDPQEKRIRYAIRKRVGNQARIEKQAAFLGMAADGSQSYFDTTGERAAEPFAMLHRGQ